MKSDTDPGQPVARSDSKIVSKGSYHDAATSLNLRSSMSPFSHAKCDVTPEWLSILMCVGEDEGSRVAATASLLDSALDDILYKSLDLGSLKDLKLNNRAATLIRTRTESMLAFVSDD